MALGASRGLPSLWFPAMATDAENKDFASNYLLLKADDVGAKGLFDVLVSRKTSKKKQYFETQKENNLADGWVLFVSLFVQKVLQLIKIPMGWIGEAMEMMLNLISNNGGFFRIFFNLFRGKVVIPDKSKKNYLSAIAHLDGRVDIDPSIERGSHQFYQALCLLAAKIAYENKAYIEEVVNNRWKMELLSSDDFWNDYDKVASTQAFMLRDKRDEDEMIIVAFRGTEPFNMDDWCSDFDLSWFKLPGVGKMHAGFMKALGMQKGKGWPKEIESDPAHTPPAYYHLRGKLRELLSANPKARFMVTGHSLGGALAILFPAVMVIQQEDSLLSRLDAVYTFGQPRVGDGPFGEFVLSKFNEHKTTYIRFVYSNDMVPRIPYDDSGRMFKHFGTCLYYNSIYKGAVVTEEPFKNYFSPFGIIPMTTNAMWEVVRGFIYPYTRGTIYRENWFMFFMRVFGLIVPGLSAHIPQDYHNSTLGAIAARIHARMHEQHDGEK